MIYKKRKKYCHRGLFRTRTVVRRKGRKASRWKNKYLTTNYLIFQTTTKCCNARSNWNKLWRRCREASKLLEIVEILAFRKMIMRIKVLFLRTNHEGRSITTTKTCSIWSTLSGIKSNHNMILRQSKKDHSLETALRLLKYLCPKFSHGPVVAIRDMGQHLWSSL